MDQSTESDFTPLTSPLSCTNVVSAIQKWRFARKVEMTLRAAAQGGRAAAKLAGVAQRPPARFQEPPCDRAPLWSVNWT